MASGKEDRCMKGRAIEATATEERLENGLKRQPDRYLAERDAEGRLTSVLDGDTSRLWVRVDGGWIWIE